MKLHFIGNPVLLASLLLASCSAPISFQRIAIKTPVGNYQQAPLSDALRELQAGKSATLELHDPLETERISIAGRNPPLAADFRNMTAGGHRCFSCMALIPLPPPGLRCTTV